MIKYKPFIALQPSTNLYPLYFGPGTGNCQTSYLWKYKGEISFPISNWWWFCCIKYRESGLVLYLDTAVYDRNRFENR